MHFSRFKTIVLILLAWFVLTASSCCDFTISSQIDSKQKISDTQGNFTGTLDDGDHFGTAVTNIGDLEVDGVTDVAVGAAFDDDGGSNRGALWVLFMDDNGQVDIDQKVSDSDGGFGIGLDDDDRFGQAIAGIGDLNRDGVRDLAVGAPLDDDGGTDRGAVWILFMNTDGSVRARQKISDTIGGFTDVLDDNDQFGSAIAGIGDINNDGINDVAVGAPFDDTGGNDRGAVYILFMNNNGTVRFTHKIASTVRLFESNLKDFDYFGSAITGIGDLDGDGRTDIAAGSPGTDDGGIDKGAVWILFLNTDGSVKREQKISATSGELDGGLNAGDRFGSAVTSIGDANDDAHTDIAVGVPFSDEGGTDRGAVWVLFLSGDGEVLDKSILASDRGSFGIGLDDGDQFGNAVTSIGDMDGNGATDLLVGAERDDDGGPDRGAAWVLFMQRAETDIDFVLFDNK